MDGARRSNIAAIRAIAATPDKKRQRKGKAPRTGNNDDTETGTGHD